MIGPAVWPPILDRHTHTQTDRQTEFVLYRYESIARYRDSRDGPHERV